MSYVMTKFEFFLKIPDMIKHKKYGYGELSIVSEDHELKKVCYIHKDTLVKSYNMQGSSWQELYDKMTDLLAKDGYLTNLN